MERLGTDYLDYYLLHAVQDNNQHMYDNYRLWDWIRGLKEQGVIRHWGFSFHAGPERLERLLTDKTRIVAVTHVSNTLGTVNPIG